MENDIIEALSNIGYTGQMLDKKHLMNAVTQGSKSVEYTEIVNYLTNELRILCNIDECVNAIKAQEDSVSFLLELSSFLKELQCPFTNLTQGHMTDRLATEKDKLLLLDYLVSELMAARMVVANKPDQKIELKIHESSTASDLKQLLLALKFNKPPPNITPVMLFQKVEPKLQETIKRAGPDLCGNPIFNGYLSEKQWETMLQVQNDLNTDYTIRREMLLKRLDCTIQSFQWSDKIKGKEDKIVHIYHNKRKLLHVDPKIDMSDLLAARDDLAIIEKTSSASVRKNTHTAINKLIIGQVPDRGGRPSEQAPPPPEMPSWQQRSAGPSSGGRGGRGGGRGGFDNFSRGGQDTYSRGGGTNYSRGGSNNYNQNHDNRGASYDNRTSGYDNRGSSYDNRGSGYDNRGSGYENRGGSYGSGYSDHDSARGGNRSYETFQTNKTTYADQYVQDSMQNQQYRGNYNNSRGQRRGQSNYNRGNYR